MPKISKQTATLQDFGPAIDAKGDIGDFTVSFVTIRETHSLAEPLKGLPNGQCPCPHWGYVFKGKMTLDYGDHQEVYSAGDAYYMTPGHVPTAEAGSEFLVFSPTEQLAEVEKAICAYMSQFQNA